MKNKKYISFIFLISFIFFISLISLISTENEKNYVGVGKCKLCHGTILKNFEPMVHNKLIKNDSSGGEKEGCEACHGPGSMHIENKGNKTFIFDLTKVPVDDLLKTCGKCHFSDNNITIGKAVTKEKYLKKSEHHRNNINCLNCHKIHSGKLPDSNLCSSCHKNILDSSSGYIHTPVAQGQCLTCHNPMGTRQRHMVVDKIEDICLSCHQVDTTFKTAHNNFPVEKPKKYSCNYCHNPHQKDKTKHLLKNALHMPFAQKNCNICHSPTNENPFALKKEEKDLCVMCHSSSLQDFKKFSVKHFPVEKGFCTGCHNPHDSNYEKLMTIDSIDYTCYRCHEQIEDDVLQPFIHPPAAQGKCNSCHKPHGSDFPKLISQDIITLCKTCHSNQGANTHPVGEEVKSPIDGKGVVCASCHKPHGGVRKYFLPKEPADLCKSCHYTVGK